MKESVSEHVTMWSQLPVSCCILPSDR